MDYTNEKSNSALPEERYINLSGVLLEFMLEVKYINEYIFIVAKSWKEWSLKIFMKGNANYFLPDKIESKVSIRVNSNPTNEAEFLTGLFAASNSACVCVSMWEYVNILTRWSPNYCV